MRGIFPTWDIEQASLQWSPMNSSLFWSRAFVSAPIPGTVTSSDTRASTKAVSGGEWCNGVVSTSATGNRTPVSRVTGGDTSHYTIADEEKWLFQGRDMLSGEWWDGVVSDRCHDHCQPPRKKSRRHALLQRYFEQKRAPSIFLSMRRNWGPFFECWHMPPLEKRIFVM